MQKQQKRVAIQRLMALASLLLALNLEVVAARKSFSLGNWRFNDPHYSSAQYAKILAENGIGHDQEPTEKGAVAVGGGAAGGSPSESAVVPLQIKYVDYQPHCASGGVPVCATNGTDHFYFENDCRLEAHNMKMLFQYGTELEPTELERCLPTCRTMKCTKVYRPVCAVAELGGAPTPTTFPNECEVRRHECQSKQGMRILHAGPCTPPPTKGRRKKKLRRSKGKRPAAATGSTSRPKVYVMLTHPLPKTSTTTTTTTTTKPMMPTMMSIPSSSTAAPQRFRQLMNSGNPMVSVSRAMDAYSVYNIDDVGYDYGEITDSTLSLFVPGVGRVTDAYPTTTTTTTTPKPETLTPMPMAMAMPIISTTMAVPTSSSTSTTTTTSTSKEITTEISEHSSSTEATTETSDSNTDTSTTDRTESL